MSHVATDDRHVRDRRGEYEAAGRPALIQQAQVIYALMMHDIKARFFGSGWGYLAMMLWPLTHLLVVVSVYSFSNRIVPYGSSLFLYSAAGVVPYIAFSYISRFMLLGVLMNRSFLQYPIIKVNDIIVSRALLEINSTVLVVAVLWSGMAMAGIDCLPIRPLQAVEALASAILLGIGLGYVNGIVTMILPLWNIIWTLVTVVVYLASGIVFLPSALPLEWQYYLSFNPVLQNVTWMRSAFYAGYDERLLDKTYVLLWGFLTFAFGVMLERLLRSTVLNTK